MAEQIVQRGKKVENLHTPDMLREAFSELERLRLAEHDIDLSDSFGRR